VVLVTVIERPQDLAWRQGEAETIALMGTINAAMARLVGTIRMLLDTDGWHGWGIQSPEHWVCWKAAVSRHRARGLVQVARRMHELPACWALFEQGRITEDAMVRIARRVPASHDADVARKVPNLLINQLDRALAACPPLPDEVPSVPPERQLIKGCTRDGWQKGAWSVPADEGAVVDAGLTAARDAEYRDRQGLDPDADLSDVPEHVRRQGVTWADALVRMASEAADALDPSLLRSGSRVDRNKVVLHRDIEPDGSVGSGQLHLGPTLPEQVAQYLTCDAEVMVAAYVAGVLIGITPSARVVRPALRRVLERRDQGCAHPLCAQKRWLHIHHIEFWEHGGRTVPSNLICLCPRHHRELHHGEFRIEGNPDDGSARFIDARGRPIEPPVPGPPRLPDLCQPSPFRSPDGERLSTLWFSWN
jgi:hypothetical protein